MSTVGSQHSVNKLNDAVLHLEEKFRIRVLEYILCAKRIEVEFYHCWYLDAEDNEIDSSISEILYILFKDVNKNYKVARRKA